MIYTYEADPNLRAMAIAAVKAEPSTDFPPVVLLSQWAAESHWGEQVTGTYNFWGIKRHPEAGPAKFCPTFEDVTYPAFLLFRADERASVTRREPTATPGVTRYHMSCWFAAYASFDESVASYTHFFVANSRYHVALVQYKTDRDAVGLLNGICRAGYANSRGYAALLLALAQQQNIRHAIEQARIDVARGN